MSQRVCEDYLTRDNYVRLYMRLMDSL